MIAEKVLKELPLDDIYIFDVHAHCGETTAMIQNDPWDDMVTTMDHLGVNSICVSSNMAFEGDNFLGNRLTLEFARRHPGRVYGYAVPNPWYEDAGFEAFVTENPAVLGIKIHANGQKCYITHPGYTRAYEIANEHQLPILFHAWNEEEVRQASIIAARYRDAPVILAHSGFVSDNTRRASIEAIRANDNVFIDTAISTVCEGALEWIVARVGADRVLYGSDLPFFDCRHTVGKIALSRLTDEDKMKIFGENARRLYRLP